VTFSKFRYISCLIILFGACLFLFDRLDLSLAISASKVNYGNHIFEFDIICESLEELPVYFKHTLFIRLKQAFKSMFLQFIIVRIDQSEHQLLEFRDIRDLLERFRFLKEFQVTVKLRIGLLSVFTIVLRVNHICIGHLI